jgi:hypothetical protein
MSKKDRCLGGNDGDLIYYQQCGKCKTVTLDDFSKPECMDWKCPTCYPVKDFPFEFFTAKQQKKHSNALGKYFGIISKVYKTKEDRRLEHYTKIINRRKP